MRVGGELLMANPSFVPMTRAILLTLPFLMTDVLCGAVLHVAASGKEGDGSSASTPVVGMHRALEALAARRKADPSKAVELILAPGTYLADRPLVLDARHSGTAQAPTFIRPSAGGRATLSLGRQVGTEDFQPVRDPSLLARMVPKARSRVVALDLAEFGVRVTRPPELFGGHAWLELYHEGLRMPLSRWPNQGYERMGEVLDRAMSPAKHGGVFKYRNERAERWIQAASEDGLWLRGFWRVPWTRQSVRVASVDPAAKTIRFAVPVPGGIGSKYGAGHAGKLGEEQWQAVNLLEEIDEPGEWSVDAKGRTLFFWPPGKGRVVISAARAAVVELRDASHVVFRDLDIAGGFGNGITVRGGTGVCVEACRIRDTAECGVNLTGGTSHEVRSCEITGTGREGVRFTGGIRKSLTPGGHRILNNHIHHTGAHSPVPAITAGEGRRSETVGNVVRHNRIHDVPNAGIVFGGNDNLIERNEIYRVGLGSSDLGAIYTNSAWTARGNIIRHNFIHHSMNANALYMDDGSCGSLIEGNIVWKAASGGFIGGGHDQRLVNNLILECTRGIHIDSRGVSRGYTIQDPGFAADLASVPYREEPWKSRYPELFRILDRDTRTPHNVVIRGNVIAGCETAMRKSGTAAHFKELVEEDNKELQDATPFIDPDHLTVRIPEGMEGLPAGFVKAFVKDIGLQIDGIRKSLPARDLAALRGKDTSKPFDSQIDVDASNRDAGGKKK